MNRQTHDKPQSPITPAQAAWELAQCVVHLMQIDAHAVGGLWLRAAHGPVRSTWLNALDQAFDPLVKLPLNVDWQGLHGGIDLSLSLREGRVQWQSGALQRAHGGVVVLPMAERAPRGAMVGVDQDDRPVVEPRFRIEPLLGAPVERFRQVRLVHETVEDPDPAELGVDRLHGDALRRAHEGELLDLYCAEMTARGVPMTRDSIWDDYVIGALHGVSTAVFSAAYVERTPRGDENFLSMARGGCALALQHGSIAKIKG